MARIDTLTNFLTDVADSIRSKTGKSDAIACEDFDTEIESISGGVDLSEYFNTTVTNPNNSYFAKNYLVKKTPDINIDANCTSLYHTFDGFGGEELKVICNHTNLTGISYAFYSMTNLLTLNLTNFNCSNVQSMSYTFSNCSKIEEIDLSKMNANSVTNMSYMFSGCNKLETINFANFDTSNVTTMRNLFYNCYLLNNLDLSNFNTENVTDMQAMFNSSSALTMNFTSLDLSNFDVSKVKNMANMFNGCKLLEELDISNFDFSGVTSYANIFRSCGTSTTTGLTKVYVKDETAQNWILNLDTTWNRPSTWSTANVIIAGSEDDLRS